MVLLDSETQELVATVFNSGPLKVHVYELASQKPQDRFVAKMERLLNISDAYKHPVFFKEVNKYQVCHTLSPNQGQQNAVLGVAELVKKIGWKKYFDHHLGC